MSQYFQIHPQNPQPRLVQSAGRIVQDGGLIVIPTDSCCALACRLDDKKAVDRLRRVRNLGERHHLTLICRDLAEISQYAKVDNRQYRFLKMATPGAYTVILEATREVPRRLSHPSRKTIGLRVPDHPITQALLEEIGAPLIGATLILPDDEHPLTDPDEMQERLDHHIDLLIDGGACPSTPTTVIDFTKDSPVLLRQGLGDASQFGL